MSPTIRIDNDVYTALQERAVAFVDTPNSVLRGILGLGDGGTNVQMESDGSAKGSQTLGKGSRRASKSKSRRAGKRRAKRKRRRAPRGSLLPESEYEIPLLRALDERGGSAKAREVIKAVGEALHERLTPVDQEILDSGTVRWTNRVQFVRLDLVQRGEMSRDSERGIWAISEQGSRRLKEAAG